MSDTPKRISPGVSKVLISELLIAVLLIGGFALAWGMYAGRSRVQQKEIPVTQLPVDVYRLEKRDFQEIFTGFGTARADRQVIVAAQVAGEITKIHPELKVGTKVSADDLLVQLDERDLEQRKKQAVSKVLEAEAEIKRLKLQSTTVDAQVEQANRILATLQEDLDRVRKLRTREVGTQTELNRVLLEYQRFEDSKLQLENQQKILPQQIAAAEQRKLSAAHEQEQAEIDKKRAKVQPPFAGVISEVFVEQGQYLRPGDRIIQLTAPEKVEIPISMGFEDYVLLADMVNAEGGDIVSPSVSFAENETSAERWTGTLRRASPVADSRSRTVEVYAEVTNESASARLLPGAFVHARIDGPAHRRKILIPRAAIRDDAVFVIRDVQVKAAERPTAEKDGDASEASATTEDTPASAAESTAENTDDGDDQQTFLGTAFRMPVRTGRTFQSLVEVFPASSEEGLQDGDIIATTNLDILRDGEKIEFKGERTVSDELKEMRVPLIRLNGD